MPPVNAGSSLQEHKIGSRAFVLRWSAWAINSVQIVVMLHLAVRCDTSHSLPLPAGAGSTGDAWFLPPCTGSEW